MSIEGRKIFLLNLGVLIFFILDRCFKNLYFFREKISFLNFRANPNFLYFFKGDFFYFLIILIFFGLIFLISKNYRQKRYLNIFVITLIFVAGFSNFWDRLLYGFVIDYFIFFNLWTFNLADLMIFGGCLFLLIDILRKK